MHFLCLFSFEKHSMVQEKRGKTSELITLLNRWLQIASTTTASATTLSCLALVWLGTVACQMLQKVVKLAASCQVTHDPGKDASTRCDSTKLGACTLVISITLSSFSPKKWPSATPSKHMDQGGFEPAEWGGRGGAFHVNGSLQPETFEVITASSRRLPPIHS